MSAALVSKILETQNVQYAVIGGIAVNVRGYLRFTRDFDFLTTAPAVLNRATWTGVEELATVEIRHGEIDDPLRGLIRISFVSGEKIDVVVGRYRWQQDVIARSEPVDIGGFVVPVPTTADLILLKLFAGGPIDRTDIHALLERGNRDSIVGEVDAHIADLPEDAQKLWSTLRGE